MKLNYFLEFLKINFLMWPTKKMSSQRHIGEFGELDRGGGYSDFFFYKGANQNKIFTGMKTGNDIYYRGEKHY